MNEFVFEASDEAATERFGVALAAAMPAGTVVALIGTLGAGKTRLVQAICAAYGVPREEVVSPTFVLCQTYEGRRTIHHLDAYRVRDEDEFRELGIDELFESEATVIVEWADRVRGVMPADFLQIEIDVTGASARRFTVRGTGNVAATAVTELRKILST
jgi:tRNA threonylcarbamoyladenosine biosynthesis protein TsaE